MVKYIDINKELGKKAAKEIHNENRNAHLYYYLYYEDIKALLNFPNKKKLISVANIFYKEDSRGCNTSKFRALTSSLFALSSFRGEHDHFRNLSVKRLKENYIKTGTICGCIGSCCGYCYPGT